MFENFETLLTEALITEAVEERKIIDAINGRYQVVINYVGSDGRAQGKRQIEIYQYDFKYKPYTQLWEKHGFIKNLSIIDLLFNDLEIAKDYILNNGSLNLLKR